MPLHSTARACAPNTNDSAPNRLDAYLDEQTYNQPTLVMDLDAVAGAYRTLSEAMPATQMYYAVKANPAPPVIARLHREGARFDAASRAEISLCIEAGARPCDISFGNTIKRPADIAWAAAKGVDLFAADAPEELEKIAASAPGARVILRLMVEHSPGDWPLARKFGCPAGSMISLMDKARSCGLRPVGLSFHVGSQTRTAALWRPVMVQASEIWHAARSAGHDLTVLNIGGGFPVAYLEPVQDAQSYGDELTAMISELFGQPEVVMAEPGRALVGSAGAIVGEVLLVARKRPSDIARWVYLDIGRFSGLAETEGEAIRYQIETSADGSETGPCILAGPSCDSVDVLYERRPVQLPLSLRAGDRVLIRATGAYTASYASVGFNGIPPLDVVCF